MKRLLTGALALILSIAANATTLTPIQLLNPTGSTSGQVIVSTGASSAPAWGGVGVNGIAAIAANTVLANATASSASPTAFAMPSCSTSASALTYTTSTGFTCNTAINAAQLGGTAAASYALLASPTFTGTPTAPTASATTNTTQLATTAMVNSAVTGGSLAGSFTTIAASSTITPSQTSGIVGTTTNNNANAGSDGEYQTATASAVSFGSGTTANLVSISLTAGDWDVSGSFDTNPAGSTTTSSFSVGMSSTTGTLPALLNRFGIPISAPAGFSISASVPVQRFSLASTTTIYLVANFAFAVSTLTADGFIRARRVR